MSAGPECARGTALLNQPLARLIFNVFDKENAIVILCSHLGRPKGTFDQALSLAPVAKRLQRLLNKPVEFVGDCIGPTVEAVVNKAQPGDVVLLENLRFHPQEEKKRRPVLRSTGFPGRCLYQ